jgi:hypothetical protein
VRRRQRLFQFARPGSCTQLHQQLDYSETNAWSLGAWRDLNGEYLLSLANGLGNDFLIGHAQPRGYRSAYGLIANRVSRILRSRLTHFTHSRVCSTKPGL